MSSRRHFSTGFLATAVLGLSAVGLVYAADPPTPTPTHTPRPAGGKSLNDVAKDKELKGVEKGKAIVITNENLSEYAEKGSVTSAGGGEKSNRRSVRGGDKVQVVDTGDSGGTGGTGGSGHTDERRRFWQSRYKSQVELVASYRYQIQVLDSEIPGLWRDFYAWDDPMYRDGVIKPKIDAAMARRSKLEGELVEAESKLNEIKSDARKDGAEPGWFRGISVPTPMPATPTPDIVIY